MQLDAESIAHITFLCFIVVFCAPVSIYCWFVAVKDRDKLYLLKRRPPLIFASLAAICALIFVYFPIKTCYVLFLPGDLESSMHPSQLVDIIIANTALFSVGVFGAARLWLLYYDTRLSKLARQSAWLRIIDAKAFDKNWFKEHANTLGNSLYLLKYGTLIIIIGNATDELLARNGIYQILLAFRFMVVLSLASFILHIWRKLRNYQYDSLGIRKEIKLLFIGAVVWGLFICIVLATVHDPNVYKISWRFSLCVLLIVTMIIMTLYPKALNKSKTAKAGLPAVGVIKRQTGRGELHMDALQQSSENLDGNIGKNWVDIVCTSFGYESLMNHLEKEFSIENLLFVSEVCCF